jgi:hypothetical protein
MVMHKRMPSKFCASKKKIYAKGWRAFSAADLQRYTETRRCFPSKRCSRTSRPSIGKKVGAVNGRKHSHARSRLRR